MEKEYEKIEKEHPKIWAYTEKDVASAHDKLEELNLMGEHYEDLSQQLK